MRYLPGFLLLLVMAAGSVAAPIKLGPRYKDESNGFQIQVPSKWEQVPTKFQEVALIGKWSGRAKRGYLNPTLHVLRFLKESGEEEPETPADAVRRGIPGYRGMMRDQPKDIWEYAQRFFWGKSEVVEDEPELRMSSKKFKAHLRVYKEKLPGGAGNRLAAAHPWPPPWTRAAVALGAHRC